jgi:hypothetical protein
MGALVKTNPLGLDDLEAMYVDLKKSGCVAKADQHGAGSPLL